MKSRIRNIISNYKILVVIFSLVAIAAGLHAISLGTKTFEEGGLEYTHYNNYKIFEYSFYHLIEGKDLYQYYPSEHADQFKYSPTFAVFFGFFSFFPDWLGLSLWNLLNALILVVAIFYLPRLNNYQKGLILVICLLELTGSIQNSQSNALVAGLIILSFGALEKGKYLYASLFIVFSIFIKLFGIVGLALLLFYPKKWKMVLYTIFWSIVLLAIPLIFIDFDHYKWLLYDYRDMLTHDHSVSYGYSVMGWLNSWFGFEFNKIIVVLTGVIIFLIPLTRIEAYKFYTFRLLTLASILIWVVIFNHKAESPTFIITMAGIAIWFVISEKNKMNIILFIIAFVLISISPTDIFPRYLREEFVFPFKLKAFPAIFIWLKIIYDMMSLKNENIELGFDKRLINN